LTARLGAAAKLSFDSPQVIRARAAQGVQMPWFRHHFSCAGCDGSWLVEAEMVEVADCPFCDARDVFPYRREDRTRIVAREDKALVLLSAAQTTSSEPNHRRLRRFSGGAKAEATRKRAAG
jgi:hypothetical protein